MTAIDLPDVGPRDLWGAKLNTAVETVAADVVAETAARGAADSALQAAVDAESAGRAAADTALADDLNDESIARGAADAAEATARAAAIAAETTARNTALALKAPLASPALTGTPTVNGQPIDAGLATSKIGQDTLRSVRDKAYRGWDAYVGDPTVAAPGLFIFGHSIVSGSGATITSRGFAQRVQRRLPVLRKGLVTTVEGHSGYTSTQLLAALPGNLAGLTAGSVACTTLMCVLNDYLYQVAPATTQTNLASIISAIKAHASSIGSEMTTLLVSEWLREDVAGSPGHPWSQYQAAMQAVAQADDTVTIFDLSTRMGTVSADHIGVFAGDSVHLTDRGHGFVADLIVAELLRGHFPGSGGLLPSHVHILIPITPAIASTNWATPGSSQQVATAYGAWVRESDGTQNASITFEMLGEAGTYSIALAHRKGSNRGQYTIAVDGATITSNPVMPIEGYNASATDVITVVTTSIQSSGKHTVTITMAGKNASSSSYIGSLSAISWTRTGDLTT